MIIRSQHKKNIVNLDNIDSIYANEYGEINAYNGNGNSRILMGQYSTEEKAIKVLDDICAFSNGIHFEKIATDQCGRLDGIVFQMPQDSEV